MGWFACDDKFVKAVRQTYRANVVAAPRAGILPLEVVAQKGSQFHLRGDLSTHLLDGSDIELPAVSSTPASSLSGQSTSNIKVGVAAELTADFLNGLGVAIPAASVEATLFGRTKKVSFQVLGVRERGIDIGELGKRLKGVKVDRGNIAVERVFYGEGPPARMLVISRVFQAASFGLYLSEVDDAGVSIEIDALKDLLGHAKADVTWNLASKRSVVFKGKRPATFAFAAIECHLSPDATFALGLEVEARLLESKPGARQFLPLDAPPISEDSLVSLDDN